MARGRYDLGLNTTIRPIASPVDTFVRPEQGGKLDQLASALSQIAPDLQRLGTTVGNIEDAKAQEQGQLDAMKTEAKDMASETRKGKLPASNNPYYMQGLREQQGRNAADKMHSDLIAALGSNEALKSSTNLEDFDKFAKQFREDWAKENLGGAQSTDFDLGFQFRAAASIAQARAGFANTIEGKVKTQANEATYGEAANHILRGLDTMTSEQLGADLNQLANDLIAQGRTPTETLAYISKAVSDTAVNKRSLKAAEVLLTLKGKSGPSSAAQGAYNEVVTTISNEKWNDDRRKKTTHDEAVEQNTKTVLAQALQDVLANPNADIAKYATQLKEDPNASSMLASVRRNAVALKSVESDEVTQRQLFSDVWHDKAGMREIFAAFQRGKLSQQDASGLLEIIQRKEAIERAENAEAKRSMFQDFAFQSAYDKLSPQRFADKITGIIAGDAVSRSAHGQAMLLDKWTQMNQSGAVKNMSEQAKQQWLTEQSDMIEAYVRSGTFSTGDVSNVPKAQFGKATPTPFDTRNPTTAVLTQADIDAARRNHMTKNFEQQAAAAGIDETELALFISAQQTLLNQKKTKKK